MRTLSVIGVEDGAILAADENGERFRIPVDESVRGRLASTALPPGKRLSPREIQAQVRAGLSMEEVAARTGAPVAYVERFVRPVLAERAFVLESAMRVVVQPDADAERASTFGAVLAERLASLNATEVSWTSLREAGGDWVVSVSFRADDIDHRARWTLDSKRLVLEPENIEAATLSQQGAPAALAPRLRALESTGPVPVLSDVEAPSDVPDRSRFDSAIFELPDLSSGAPQQGPVEAEVLLDALARKRIQRESVSTVALPASGGVSTVDDLPAAADAPHGTVTRGRFPEPVPQPRPEAEPEPDAVAVPEDVVPLRRPRDRSPSPEPQPRPQAQPPKVRQNPPQQTRQSPARHVDPDPAPNRPVGVPPAAPRSRRGRTSLPSWDEIVFGKADD